MKKLEFKDGTKAYFTDDSTIYLCKIIFSKFSDIDDVAEAFTEENLNGGTFDGEPIEDIVPLNIRAERNKEGDNIVVCFNTRNKTKDELLQKKLDEVDELLAKLKGQLNE